ncbi:MAG: CrcB family protein [Flavobacteriales bacterium]|nr:CrcB family protein [Flavobacteriales bacterium]
MTYLLVFIGGGMGCMARYAVASLVAKHYSGSYPIATFISNTLSCLILLAVLMLLMADNNAPRWARPLLIIGFCGGFSTFSTFSFETVHLIKNGNPWVAAVNVMLSLGVCLAIAYRASR